MFSGNIIWIRKNELEFFHLISERRRDIIILCETRSKTQQTMNTSSTEAKVFATLPRSESTRACTTVIGRPGVACYVRKE